MPRLRTVDVRPWPSSQPPPVRTTRPASNRTPGERTRSPFSSASRALPERANPTSATTDHATSTAPSTRDRRPSRPNSSSGTGPTAVQIANPGGSSSCIGAITAARPATPSAGNVMPPKNVPAAAPARHFALAAIPAARFSVSKPDKATVRTNGRDAQRPAHAKQAVDDTSAAQTTSAIPPASAARPSAVEIAGPSASAHWHHASRALVLAAGLETGSVPQQPSPRQVSCPWWTASTAIWSAATGSTDQTLAGLAPNKASLIASRRNASTITLTSATGSTAKPAITKRLANSTMCCLSWRRKLSR